MSDIIEAEPQIVMVVSEFSGIAQRLNFMAQSIQNEEEAKTANVYIECFTRTEKEKGIDKEVNVIRFSTDLNLWTEIHPYNKYTGALLEYSVAVNLFDFYNIVDNCKDDLVHFTIDVADDGEPELTISSFYNDQKDINELEVTMAIHEFAFPVRELTTEGIAENKITSLELSNLTLYNLIAELNVEQSTDGVNIIIEDGKIRFQSDYNGYKSEITLKEHEEQVFDVDCTIYIPFYVFNLMSATGHVNNLRFDVYPDLICVETNDYKFAYKTESKGSVFKFDTDGFEEHFVVECEEMESMVGLLNRVNKPSPISLFKLEKVDTHHMDVQAQCKGRYNASGLVTMAVLSDSSLICDGDLLEDLFKRTNVDAIKVKSRDGDKFIAEYENAILFKTVQYDHESFMDFRNKKFAEWKTKKDS